MSDDRGSLGIHLLLFLLGAAAGAVVVALTTPKNGPDLRADLRRLTRRLRHKATETGRHWHARYRRDAAPEPEHDEMGL